MSASSRVRQTMSRRSRPDDSEAASNAQGRPMSVALAQALLSQPDGPRLDRLDHQVRLVPRVAGELAPELLLVVRRDGERHPVVKRRPAEEKEAALGERVHVVRVLLPERLL